ncbi:Arylsulfatase [Planctomycetes bacterium MalM25]|nr:Arylsulfatase [Planctomycetes bacterium MalM25]
MPERANTLKRAVSVFHAAKMANSVLRRAASALATGLLCAVTLGMLATGKCAFAAEKLNVIVIMADDISANEFPIHGVPEGGVGNSASSTPTRTPNLDRIASEGAWIKTAWSAPVCGPTRAMIMTGRYAHQHGWYANNMKASGSFYQTSTDSSGQRQIIGHVAKQAGYATVWAGKSQMPELDQYGFDEGIFYTGYDETIDGQVSPYSDFQASDPYKQGSWYWKPKLKRMNHPDDSTTFAWAPANQNGELDYGQDLYIDTIFDFVNRHTDDPTTSADDGEATKPFFAYYTPNLGHRAVDYLNAEQLPNGDYLGEQDWAGTPALVLNEETGRWSRQVETYQQQQNSGDPVVGVTENHIDRHVEYLDYQVQQITDELERLEIADNTVLIFTTDNGTWGYGKNQITKQRGTHVPFIVYAPGQLAVQGEQDILVELTDVWPTLADITGFEPPTDYDVDGESLWGYLTGETSEHREWISSYYADDQLIRGKNVLRDGRGDWYDTRGASDGDSFIPLTEDSDPELLAEKRMLELALEGIPSLEESQYAGAFASTSASLYESTAAIPEPTAAGLTFAAALLGLRYVRAIEGGRAEPACHPSSSSNRPAP